MLSIEDDAKTTIGKFLKHIRKVKGISLEEASGAIDMSSSWLSVVERGETATTTDRLEQLAFNAYGYEWKQFISLYAEYLQDTNQQASLPPPITLKLPKESGQKLLLQSGDVDITISITSKS